jgi:hypothetical protein
MSLAWIETAVNQEIRSSMNLKQLVCRGGMALAAVSYVLLAPASAFADAWTVSVTGYNYNELPIDQFKVTSDEGTASGANMPALAYSGGEGSGTTCCYRIGGKTLSVSYQLWTAAPGWKQGDPEPPFLKRTIPMPSPDDPKARILEVYFLPDGSVQSKLVSERDRGPIPFSAIMDRIIRQSPGLIADYPSVAGRDLLSERLAHGVIRGWMLGLRTEGDLYNFGMRGVTVNVHFAEDPSIAPALNARKGNARAIMTYLDHGVSDATWKRLAAEQQHYDATQTREQDARAKRRAVACKNAFEPCKQD